MSCDELTDLIDAYVDGELTAPQHATVVGHIASCPGCAGIIAARQALRNRVREAGGYLLPAGLSERVSLSLTELDSGRTPLQFIRHQPWWLLGTHAATAALGALALLLYLSGGSGDIGSEVLSAHMRSLTAEQIGPVASSESHTVRPWFAGKIDFAPPVADLAAAGFPLLSGHIDVIGTRPVAALAYGRRLHRITLFIRPVTAMPRGASGTSLNGYQIVSWHDETFAYWAISDLNRAELTEFQQDFQRAIKQTETQ